MPFEKHLEFMAAELPPHTEALRKKVRALLDREIPRYSAEFRSNSWNAVDAKFSQKMGQAGLLGITLPKAYGGAGLTNIERYVVSEEVLFAGAPVGFHWIADRQSGPLILRHGSEEQKGTILPGICRGEISFCIGMSEPNAGSDLAGIQSRAVKTSDGWRLNGTKLWSTAAHVANYMIGLFRTDPGAAIESKHAGLSQFVINLKQTKGVTVRPIKDLAGHQHFNEVIFEDAILPEDAILGTEGQGWKQAMEELSLERSGPERFLSCMLLFTELAQYVQGKDSVYVRKGLGRMLGDLITLRDMSIAVTTMLAKGENVSMQAAIVKDLGAEYEQRMPGIVQNLVEIEPSSGSEACSLARVLANLTMIAPSFSLRGGTVEILRGIIAKGLGVG